MLELVKQSKSLWFKATTTETHKRTVSSEDKPEAESKNLRRS
jgi:hypothetical protein